MWLRHPKGNGKIDSTSEVCAFSTISKNSQISEKSSVWSSHLTNTQVRKSTICNSIIENSTVLNSLITGGKISDSFIAAELIADFAVIEKSGIYDKSRIAHTAKIVGCNIWDATVTGDAQLLNWPENFYGHECYISRGIWTRPPRILALDGLTITESVPNFAFAGCREFSIPHWLKIGDRYGAKLGLSRQQVRLIRQFLNLLTA